MHQVFALAIMRTVALYLNAFASLASAGWALAALVRPPILSNSRQVELGELFYSRMYAARSIPGGLTVAILPFCSGGRVVATVLFIAAVVQFADVLIAVDRRDFKMLTGASIGGAAHILCGLTII